MENFLYIQHADVAPCRGFGRYKIIVPEEVQFDGASVEYGVFVVELVSAAVKTKAFIEGNRRADRAAR